MEQDLAKDPPRSSNYSPNEDWVYFKEKLLQEAPRLFLEGNGTKVLLEFTVKSDLGHHIVLRSLSSKLNSEQA